MIYFIQHGDDGPIKIGVALHVRSRLSALQSATPVQLRLLATQPGGERIERDLHSKFAELRVRGEWFRPDAKLLAHIGSLSNAGTFPVQPPKVKSAAMAGGWPVGWLELVVKLRSANPYDVAAANATLNLAMPSLAARIREVAASNATITLPVEPPKPNWPDMPADRPKKRRRKRGTGTVFFHASRQVWVARKRIRRRADGGWTMVERYGETQEEAMRRVAEAEAACAE